jgi:hypothetical protein
MRDAEWVASTDPLPMMLHLGERASARKLRLYACAWGYSVWDRLTDERSRQAVLTAELFADGLADSAELLVAFNAARHACNEIPEVRGYRRVRGNKALTGTRTARRAAEVAQNLASPEWDGQMAQRIGLGENTALKLTLANHLRDIFGVPGRSIVVDLSWISWQGGIVRRLAETIYEDRSFDHLSVLADALEEAGCTDPEILSHCRQPTTHTRGCWVLDLLLGKE